MLRRAAAALGLALVGAGLIITPARADVGCATPDQATGVCSISVPVPGSSGGNTGSSSETTASTTAGPGTCAGPDGTTIPCSGPEGAIWYAPMSCYAKDITDQYMPPEAHEEFWGNVMTDAEGGVRTHGVALQCVEPAGAPFAVFDRAGTLTGGPGKPKPMDPAVVARMALEQMHLHAGQIGITPNPGPDKMGVVGMPSWMWISDPGPETTGPQTKTVTAGGTTVTVDASVTSILWNMGDGGMVTCIGAGTPYDPSYVDADSPTCGYRFQKQGVWTVTATTTWAIRWNGGGQSGTIPLTTTRQVTIAIGEIQVVETRPGK